MDKSAWAEQFRALVDGDNGLTATPLVRRDNFEKHFVYVREVTTWGQLQHLICDQFHERRWLFRGQSRCPWRLETSLDRAVIRQKEEDGQWKDSCISYPNRFEPELLIDFQRGAQSYFPSVPRKDERLEWLALMQHYGVPTRLLDWTFSPYVALNFALEGSAINTPCALWVIDLDWVIEKAGRVLSSSTSAM